MPYSFGVMIISLLAFAVWLIVSGLKKENINNKRMEKERGFENEIII